MFPVCVCGGGGKSVCVGGGGGKSVWEGGRREGSRSVCGGGQ